MGLEYPRSIMCMKCRNHSLYLQQIFLILFLLHLGLCLKIRSERKKLLFLLFIKYIQLSFIECFEEPLKHIYIGTLKIQSIGWIVFDCSHKCFNYINEKLNDAIQAVCTKSV